MPLNVLYKLPTDIEPLSDSLSTNPPLISKLTQSAITWRAVQIFKDNDIIIKDESQKSFAHMTPYVLRAWSYLA